MSELAVKENQTVTIGELARKRKASLDASNLIAPQVSAGLESTNINHYRKSTGHGYAAEDANALQDFLRGRKVETTGQSNTLNGPDRIVDGVHIQTKYCKDAASSLNAAFDSSGQYRYEGQVLEVPKDQYQEVLQLMRERIEAGQVPGVSDPAKAEEIVKEGNVTYQQAVNIAKAGNIDSLIYDAQSQIVSTSFAFSLSFVITFASQKLNGADTKTATRAAMISGLQVGGISMLSGVVTAQLLRTDLIGGVGKVVAKNIVDAAFKTEMGKRFIIKYAQAMTGKEMGKMAARNYAAKMLRSNVVTGTVVTVVMTSPDIYRAAFHKSVSWAQVSKNFVVGGSGVAGGMAGAAYGATLGSAILPGIGTTIGGILGGLGGGWGGGKLAKKGMDVLIDDDAKKLLELLPDFLVGLAVEFMLTEDEVEQFSSRVSDEITPKYLRTLQAAPWKLIAVRAKFKPICEEIVQKRPRIMLPSPEEIIEAEVEFVNEFQQAYQDEKQVAVQRLMLILIAAADLPSPSFY